MRVPTREHRFFVAPQPAFGQRDRRDERVPRGASAAGKAAFVQARQPDDQAAAADSDAIAALADVSHLVVAEGFELSSRLAALLHEASWERILRKHGLSDDM